MARLGKWALFCEVNPVLQFIVPAKAGGLKMQEAVRASLVGRVLKFTDSFRGRMCRAASDENLRRAYASTFGDSLFFDGDAFEPC